MLEWKIRINKKAARRCVFPCWGYRESNERSVPEALPFTVAHPTPPAVNRRRASFSARNWKVCSQGFHCRNIAGENQMKFGQDKDGSALNQSSAGRTTCPLWKKMLAGILAVIAVALLIQGTVWFDDPGASLGGAILGLAAAFAYSIVVVVVGVALVSLFLWVLSRSPNIMKRGKSAVEYVVHCYPQQLRDRILHRT